MHEFALHFFHFLSLHPRSDTSPTSSTPDTPQGIYTTLIITAGTVLTSALLVLGNSFNRRRNQPSDEHREENRSADDREARWAREAAAREADRIERERINHQAQVAAADHSQFVQQVLAAVTTDRDNLERDLEEARSLYQKLREAVVRHGLSPDELLMEI